MIDKYRYVSQYLCLTHISRDICTSCVACIHIQVVVVMERRRAKVGKKVLPIGSLSSGFPIGLGHWVRYFTTRKTSAGCAQAFVRGKRALDVS